MKTLIVAFVGMAATAVSGVYGWHQKEEAAQAKAEAAMLRRTLTQVHDDMIDVRKTMSTTARELRGYQAEYERLTSEIEMLRSRDRSSTPRRSEPIKAIRAQ
jgi:prophage tail gpP-like protein